MSIGPQKMAVKERFRRPTRHKKPNDIIAQRVRLVLILFTFATLSIWDMPRVVVRVLALEERDGVFSSDSRNSFYLPITTHITESPRLLTVTKALLRTRTTSTVSPWPSHKFLRSVLSRSDNIIANKRNRSKSTRKSQSHGTTVQPSFKSPNSTGKFRQQVRRDYTRRGNGNATRNNYPPTEQNQKSREIIIVSPRRSKIVTSEESKMQKLAKGTYRHRLPLDQDKAARSATFMSTASVEKNANRSLSRSGSRRQLPHPLIVPKVDGNNRRTQTTEDPPLHRTSFAIKTNESVLLPSEPKTSSIWDANVMREGSKVHEYSRIYNPQFGFQYEIVVPPPPPTMTTTTMVPKQSYKKSLGNTSVKLKPTAISTTLHVPSSYEANSSGNRINKTTTNSTTSAVIVNNGGTGVTGDDATRTASTSARPTPSRTKMKGSEDSDTTTTPATSPPTKVPIPFQNFHYNKSSEVISQSPQYPQKTPTHNSQLNAYLNKMNKSSSENWNQSSKKDTFNSTAFTSPNPKKSRDKAREEIKRKELSQINHNLGDVQRRKTTSTALAPPTFQTNLKDGLKQSPTDVNKYLGSFHTTHAAPMNSWGYYQQPTQSTTSSSPIQSVTPTKHFRENMKLSSSNHNKPNQAFQKRFWNKPGRVNPSNHNNDDDADPSRISYMKGLSRPKQNNQTTLLHRKNMFTVVNRPKSDPKIRVVGKNVTSSRERNKLKIPRPTGFAKLPSKVFYDRTNQLQRPSVMTSILAGPDRSSLISTVSSSGGDEFNTESDNDYFDDSQANLHHWIEQEQGHSVSYSAELPTFTNLTWPYYITDSTNNDTTNGGKGEGGIGSGGSKGKTDLMSPASTGLSVSFSNIRDKEKSGDFNSRFEFYIPSAAADPNRNPILVAKPSNSATTTEVNFESVSPKPPPTMQSTNVKHQLSPTDFHKEVINSLNRLKQSPYKEKIKQSHWGSNGVSIKQPPQNSEKVKHPFESHLNQYNNMKVYESSTGNPKSSPAPSPFSPSISSHRQPQTHAAPPRKSPTTSTFLLTDTKKQKHYFTSPSPQSSSSSWAFEMNGGGGGQTEIASFVTAKTPTNIWYKPIINHFTASVPHNNDTSLLYEYNKAMNGEANSLNTGGSSNKATPAHHDDDDTSSFPGWYTKQPPTTKRKGYVGESDDDTSFGNSNNDKKQKVFESNGGGGVLGNAGIIHQGHNHNSTETIKGPILFNVWNLVNGKLKLENQREIPSWALNGYLLPQSGTILNLQQIPPALQPLVTNAINREAEVNDGNLSYVWKKLPILGSFDALSSGSVKMDRTSITTSTSTTTSSSTKPERSTTTRGTTTKTTTSTTTTTTTTTTEAPAESLFEDENNQLEIPSSANGNVGVMGMLGWNDEEKDKEVMHSKRPISINYVLWNNPASIYGQSIILSTPPPHLLLSPQPTPVSYFPSSPITPFEENSVRPAVILLSASSTTTTAPPTEVTEKNPESDSSSSSTISQEKLELLFQKYFQYFITTPATPAAVSTTRPLAPLDLANKVYGESYGESSSNNKAWNDLKKLILRLAGNKKSKKDSLTLDKNKAEDLEFLGNVASIAVIMSYLRNQYDTAVGYAQNQPTPATGLFSSGAPLSLSTTSQPYGVTDDMTPPHKDQLWATVYPLFQHYLNNPGFTFIPPHKAHHYQSTSYPHSEVSLTSTSPSPSSQYFTMTPTSVEQRPIPFTEPATFGPTGSTNSDDYYTRYNHYLKYSTAGARSSTVKPVQDVSFTEVPHHGATTQIVRSESKLGEVDETKAKIQAEKLKTLLLIKKLKKKKKRLDKKKKKKKDLIAAGLIGGSLLKKISKLGVMKKPKKYWLDLKFDIDFYDILKKKLLYLIAYQYMPVALVLAFGLIPLALSLVPLLYKMWWMKWKKPKYIKVKVPVPFPSPYPVPVYKPPPPPYGYYHNDDGHHHPGSHGHSPPDEQLHRPEYGNDNYDPDIIHIDSQIQQQHQHRPNANIMRPPPPPPLVVDHHYAADSSGMRPPQMENSSEERGNPAYRRPPFRNQNDGVINSFNYDYVKHSTPTREMKPYPYPYQSNDPNQDDQDQEIHVHLHDQESSSNFHPQVLPGTQSPPRQYTSYHRKEQIPYHTPSPWEMEDMTNHDIEILKILVDTKKEKINRLLEMWRLAKYGVQVASDAASNAAASVANTVVGGIVGATTPLSTGNNVKRKKKRKTRRKRRRKRRKLADSSRDQVHN